jgi:hypothetical protein
MEEPPNIKRKAMNEKIVRMRYLNLKQHIDALFLAKLIDEWEALHIIDRLKKQVGPSGYEEDLMSKKSQKLDMRTTWYTNRSNKEQSILAFRL